jgi:hypothetical protein
MKLNSGIKTSFGKITVDKVEENSYKKGLYQAQLRQVVTTTYPSKRVGNSESDSLFEIDAFDLGEGKEYTSERLCWLDVPNGTSKKKVEELLKANPKAKIWRKISYDVTDVLTEEQIGAMEAGITTREALEESKVVKDADGDVVDDGNGPQYRQYFFSKDGMRADIDYRGTSNKSVGKAKNEGSLVA